MGTSWQVLAYREAFGREIQSPYLFLFPSEALSCLLKSRIQSSNSNGIIVFPSKAMVSLFLFADDNLLLFKTTESADKMRSALLLYYHASGQQVNMDKSLLFIFLKGVRPVLEMT